MTGISGQFDLLTCWSPFLFLADFVWKIIELSVVQDESRWKQLKMEQAIIMS